MSKVSVIITTHNQERLVPQAVESVLAQAFRDFEVFVVDDGSTDDTPETLVTYADRITCIQQPHQGIMAARMTGTQATTGTYLSFMRADDLMPPERLGLQVQQLEAQPGLGLAYFGGQIWDGEATQIIRPVDSNGEEDLNSSMVAIDLFLSGCPLIRRNCVEQARLLEAPSSPDRNWDPWQQMTLAGYKIDGQEQFVLCWEHLMIALRKLHLGQPRAAQRHMTEVVRLSPGVVREPAMLLEAILDYTENPDVSDPAAFDRAVLDNLPDCAWELKRLRPRILGELSIARAFGNHALGAMAQARYYVISGLRHDLSFLRNRGVVSIFCKSLLSRDRKPTPTSCGNQEFDVWHLMIQRIQEALGQPVDTIEPTVGGTDRATYVVKSGERPFILRVGKEQSDILAHRPDLLTLSQVRDVTEQVRAAGVPVPLIVAYNFPDPDTTDPSWILEEWVPGHPFIPQNMLWRDALAAATDLGRCLRQLHSIETRGFGAISSERLEATHHTFDQWLESDILDKCKTLTTLPSETLSVVDTAGQFLRGSYSGSPRLCHGDPNPWNLLANRGHLVAIIDWNPVYGWDPAFDVATFYFWIDDEPTLTAVLQAYAPDQPGIFRRRVIAAAICYAARLMATACKSTIDKSALDRRCLRWLTDRTYRW